MNFDNNFEKPTLPADKIKEYKKLFSRIFFATSIFIVAIQAAAELLSYLLLKVDLPFMHSPFFSWVFNAVCIYAIGLPVLMLAMLGVPAVKPEKSKMKFSTLFFLFAIIMLVSQIGGQISNILTNLIQGITGVTPPNSLNDAILATPWYVILIFVGIVGPIFEEIIFRKVILTRLLPFGELTALLISAGIFALFHGNFYQLFYTFGFGLVVGYAFIKTGKLIYPIILHVVYNIVGSVIPVILIPYLQDDVVTRIFDLLAKGEFTAFTQSDIISLVCIYIYGLYSMGIMVLAVLGAIYFFRNLRKIHFKPARKYIPSTNRGEVIFLNAGAIVLIVINTILIALNTFLV